METWDIYDIYRNYTGRSTDERCKLEKGEYHLSAHICIFNLHGEMLIQQRQKSLNTWPSRWDLSAGGSAISGDSSYEAAERETFEEIGLKLDLKYTRPHLTLNFPTGFDDIYLLEIDVDLDGLKLQKEEVQRVKWASKEEIINKIENDEFVPYYPSLIKMLFDIRKSYKSYYK